MCPSGTLPRTQRHPCKDPRTLWSSNFSHFWAIFDPNEPYKVLLVDFPDNPFKLFNAPDPPTMLAKFGRSHRGNCYRIYFEKSPSNPFLSLIPRLQPENPENSKGRSEKESLFKIFWVQVYKHTNVFVFFFSSSSLFGGLN